ncbi:MAG: hypothetical protein J6Y85_02080 [Alphaproteobacteria bacterium]|nr:hypothetical protein [Alphaproteobacteria bacterium]
MKNINESGRSMVEMLGVLAIIGVLSIGGIAGYTRAMRNWRVNEILDAASKVAAMVETKLATESLTYNDMVGSTGAVGKIAGGVVSEIEAYGMGFATTAKANTVEVTLKSGETDLQTAIEDRLTNCSSHKCDLNNSIKIVINVAAAAPTS